MSVWNSLVGSNEAQHSDSYEDQRRELIELWNTTEKGGANEYRQLEARIYRIGNQKNQRHICTEFCLNHPIWATKENLVGSIMDVFVNANTRDYHVCSGPDCGAEHVCSDGASTCTVSGLQFTEQRFRTAREMSLTNEVGSRILSVSGKKAKVELVDKAGEDDACAR